MKEIHKVEVVKTIGRVDLHSTRIRGHLEEHSLEGSYTTYEKAEKSTERQMSFWFTSFFFQAANVGALGLGAVEGLVNRIPEPPIFFAAAAVLAYINILAAQITYAEWGRTENYAQTLRKSKYTREPITTEYFEDKRE